MNAGLSFHIIDPDEYYNGVEIRAWNERFSAKSFLYLGFTDLTKFGSVIAGFPQSLQDDRKYVFGTRDRQVAGGFCSLHFHSVHLSQVVDVSIDDDDRFSEGKVEFRIPVEASWVDRFVESLAALERNRAGEALLAPSL